MKYYGANKIFENISFDIKTGERIGLIGQNGCGKTTLMKIIMGFEDCQEGSIAIRKDATIGYLNQIPDYKQGTTTIDVLNQAFEKVFKIKKQMNEYENKLSIVKDDNLNKVLNEYGHLTEQFEALGGYEIETKVNKVVEGLKITDVMIDMEFDKLSGGEKTRVILGKILLEQPDVLLLDEPTNHLDLDAIIWLEEFLKEYRGSVLIISHDRYFLDRVVNRIIEMSFDEITNYNGNYSYYTVEKERRFEIDYNNYLNQQKKIDKMEKQIERYRIWGKMRDSEVMYKRAKELEKRLEKIDVLDKPVSENKKISFNEGIISRTGKIVLTAENINKSFNDKCLLKELNLELYYRDRLCIMGGNGSGKTTFIKIILNELKPDGGTIKIGSRVKIGYLPQEVVYEDEDITVLNYFAGLHDITTGEARSQLAKVMFIKEDVNKKIKSLSGGEKSRLKLCSLTYEKVNFLVLDEPTNHLDIDSREVLEETLNNFEGTLLFVSHDRYFINSIANRMALIYENRLKIYNGDYSYFQEQRKKETDFTDKQVFAKIKNERPIEKESTEKANKLNIKRLEDTELEINETEKRIKSIDYDMAIYSFDAEKLKMLFDEKNELENSLLKLYEKWEALQQNLND